MSLSLYEMVICIVYGIIIYFTGYTLRDKNKMVSISIEVGLSLLALIFIFTKYNFLETFPYIFFITGGYSISLSITDERKKVIELKKKLKTLKTTNVNLTRDMKRAFTDFGITFIVFLGAILFLIFGPEPTALKTFIFIAFLFVIPEIIKRVFVYLTTNITYNDTTLFIVSHFEAREIPFKDIEDIKLLTNVDILKLHPLLTFLSTRSDFTTSFNKAVLIQLPSEEVYITIEKPEILLNIIEEKRSLTEVTDVTETKEVIHVLPFYHWKNIKRLLGKLYYAITVKGISAYTGLLLILYFLKAPEWIIVIFIILYWLINLYFSDRVLKIAMDAEEINDTDINEVANRVFSKAGIKHVKVYKTESNEFNGMATGMNIGRAMVTLTTATLKLPLEHIEGILAHEAVHVKKRDVLLGQLLRIPYFTIVIGIVLYFQNSSINLEENILPIFFLVWILIMLFPVYQSFYMQWMEVRADHFGSNWLDGGKLQMAESLKSLGMHQDVATKKMMEYRMTDVEKESFQSILERGPRTFRFLEFQFLPHPPMYWRIQVLLDENVGWKKGILKRWMKDRLKESFSK